MVVASFLSSIFKTKLVSIQEQKNRKSDWTIEDKIASNGSTTYGSGSLNCTSNGTMINESSVLVANGDLDLEYSDDEDPINDENIDDILDAYYASCTWTEYFFSWRFFELLQCVVPFTALWMKFESNTMIPRTRPIPFQPVITTIIDERLQTAMKSSTLKDSNGDAWGWQSPGMVWNHVNSEKFLNETIGHKEYQILCGLLPWLLQLVMVFCLVTRRGRRWDALHRTTCMYFVGIGTTDVITNCVKYYVSEILLQPFVLRFALKL